jgi:molybdopterin-guanine dinucleotide biosynthesis protein MobB
VGWSGSGKTRLLERLVPELRRRGHRVGYLKSDVHGFDMDREGKDTYRLFESGAERVAIASPQEGALRFRLERKDARALLAEHFRGCDVVLVEGFRGSDLPKVEVASREPVLRADDPTLVAVVSDAPDPRPVPRFPPSDVEGMAGFVEKTVLGRMGAR